MRKENVSLLVLSAVYEILERGRYTFTLITQRILHLSKNNVKTFIGLKDKIQKILPPLHLVYVYV